MLALLVFWFGWIGVWRTRFETRLALSRPDCAVARWQRASADHPLLSRLVLGTVTVPPDPAQLLHCSSPTPPRQG
jgi:hypothetical protein